MSPGRRDAQALIFTSGGPPSLRRRPKKRSPAPGDTRQPGIRPLALQGDGQVPPRPGALAQATSLHRIAARGERAGRAMLKAWLRRSTQAATNQRHAASPTPSPEPLARTKPMTKPTRGCTLSTIALRTISAARHRRGLAAQGAAAAERRHQRNLKRRVRDQTRQLSGGDMGGDTSFLMYSTV